MIKKILKILGITVGVVLGIVALVAAWIGLSGEPQYETSSLTTQRYADSAHLALGRRIVSLRCAYCHLGDDAKLSGRRFTSADNPFGEIWTQNITRSVEHGIGSYSDGQLAFLLRTGIKKDGSFAGPYMSSVLQSDEEINSVISFLRSEHPLVTPSEISRPKHTQSFLEKALQRFGLFVPLHFDGKVVPAPNESDSVLFGKYLVQARYECAPCHSQSFETFNHYKPEESPGYLGGGNVIDDREGKLHNSANITPSLQHGIGSWTYEQFEQAVRNGQSPKGRRLSDAMPRCTVIDPGELRCMWLYLRSVPPLEH